MKHTLNIILTALLLTTLAALHAAETSSQTTRPDITLADFEQGYGDWTVQGKAFDHPTTRTQAATGFVGKGLANSSGERFSINAGSLTSPGFIIGRRYLRFLVGGRGFDAGTSVQLLIDGILEFYACGAGDRQLRPVAFDVSSFQGRQAQVIICDEGMWHDILVDELVAGDSPGKTFQVRSLRPTWKTANKYKPK